MTVYFVAAIADEDRAKARVLEEAGHGAIIDGAKPLAATVIERRGLKPGDVRRLGRPAPGRGKALSP